MFANRFSLYDVEFNESAVALNMANSLPVRYYENVESLAVALQVIEESLGITLPLVSWYMSEEVLRELCRQNYLKDCVANRLPVNAATYLNYVKSNLHNTGQKVKLRRWPNDVKDLEPHKSRLNIEFFKHHIAISDFGEHGGTNESS